MNLLMSADLDASRRNYSVLRTRTKILIESSDTAVGFSTCLLAAVQPYSRTAVQLYKFSFLFFMHARCRSVAVFLPELSTVARVLL